MIVEEKFYGIKCDQCGDYLQCENSGGEHCDDFETNKQTTISHAICAGWEITDDGKHYCMDCWKKMTAHGLMFGLIDLMNYELEQQILEDIKNDRQ